ncbi:MAG: DUF2075 domain-containing protein [Akkermansia sp.]|nr:DUF2075 domain-containing protein [Akkermansia sp.]
MQPTDFLTIADEAHSQTKTYIEESNENVTFTTKGVWPEGIGPQAFYVMYTSQISIFLMEDKQGFTDRETTKVNDIIKLAKEDLGVKKGNIQHFRLTEQYRCGGSCDYIDWIENLLSDSPDMQFKDKIKIKSGNEGKEEFWFKNKAGENSFCVQITNYPSDMEEILRSHIGITNSSVRLVSSYSVPWKSNSAAHGTKDISPKAKQELEPHKKDFYLPDRDGKYWSRVWNTAQQFVMPVDNIEMQKDPLCEVGYPQEIRGWDFNHLGILWLDDLLWRNGKWGLRANVNESRPFRGKKSTEKNPDPEWAGSVLDGGISSCRLKADLELISIKNDIKNAISSLKSELKKLNKSVKSNEKDLKKANNIDFKRTLQQEIQSINASIEKLTSELSAKENELKELLQTDIVICKNDSTPCINALIDKVLNIYRILLTRALKGNVIYVKDPETREHLRELLK